MTPKLSIVIPAFNEEARIASMLDTVLAYADRQQFTFEVIVVDDGSKDRTREIVRSYGDRVILLPLLTHQGKGAAVRAGMLRARGTLRAFTDADNSTDIEQLDLLMPGITKDCGIVIGSRRVKGAVITTPQSTSRMLLGIVFRVLVDGMMRFRIHDTQNGFKLFSAGAAERIFRAVTTPGWMFDIEVLAIARKLRIGVREVPIVWKDSASSTLRLTHAPRILVDVLKIRNAYPPHRVDPELVQ